MPFSRGGRVGAAWLPASAPLRALALLLALVAFAGLAANAWHVATWGCEPVGTGCYDDDRLRAEPANVGPSLSEQTAENLWREEKILTGRTGACECGGRESVRSHVRTRRRLEGAHGKGDLE